MYLGYREWDSDLGKEVFVVCLEGTKADIRRVKISSTYFSQDKFELLNRSKIYKENLHLVTKSGKEILSSGFSEDFERCETYNICPKCGSKNSEMIRAKGTEWYKDAFEGRDWNPFYVFGNLGMHCKCLDCGYEEEVKEAEDGALNRVPTFIYKVCDKE